MSRRSAVDALARATDALVRAANAHDPEGIDQAVAERGRLISQLAPELASLSEEERRRVLRTLALAGAAAEDALTDCARTCKNDLANLRGAVLTARRYSGCGSAHGGSLDRTG